MTEQSRGGDSVSRPLPESPSLDWLRKEAKRNLAELRRTQPAAKLADAQFALAKRYGFPSWRALKAHVDSLGTDGQLVEAARTGDVRRLAALLDRYPDRRDLRAQPYEFTLLHVAAQHGQLACVDLLLARGLDANSREQGDNTYPMHWAAAAGRLDIVQRLADAGGDVIGHGDDHELEVIGWATCWDGCDDDAHRAVVDFLVSRGARHHIFSAIAMGLADEVRRIVRDDAAALHQRMSRNEGRQTPLHFAVGRRRPEMLALLLELGADPLAVDDADMPVIANATGADADRPVLERIRELTVSELRRGDRGRRLSRGGTVELVAALALGDRDLAARLVRDNPRLANGGALHLLAKRGSETGVSWMLAHGADPNARWAHWDAEVTPLHLAALGGHADVVRVLLNAGANPAIRDSKHDGDALGWAEHFGQVAVVRLLRATS